MKTGVIALSFLLLRALLILPTKRQRQNQSNVSQIFKSAPLIRHLRLAALQRVKIRHVDYPLSLEIKANSRIKRMDFSFASVLKMEL